MILCNAQDHRMAQAPNLLGSAEVCAEVGIDRSTLSRWIKDGTARPAMQLPGKTGAYLFERTESLRLATAYRAMAGARSA